MQSAEIQQARVVANFLMAARRHFGLALAVPPTIRQRGPFGQLRPVIRSLLVAGSLGTVLAQPVFAQETFRPANERETVRNSSKREVSAPLVPPVAARGKKSTQN